jgi:hypothetical protein
VWTPSRITSRTALVLTAVVLSTCLSLAENYGFIEGTVVNESGSPVADARVYAYPMDHPMAAIVPQATTDESGTFRITTLDYGRYVVSAAKPDDGYPALLLTLYTGFRDNLPRIRLPAKQRSARVSLRLGSKTGILVGTVADAVTGKPLNANVEFRWALEPRNFLSGSGLTNAEFRIPIPSNHPVTMVVSLEGYENWGNTSPIKSL